MGSRRLESSTAIHDARDVGDVLRVETASRREQLKLAPRRTSATLTTATSVTLRTTDDTRSSSGSRERFRRCRPSGFTRAASLRDEGVGDIRHLGHPMGG